MTLADPPCLRLDTDQANAGGARSNEQTRHATVLVVDDEVRSIEAIQRVSLR